MGVGVTSGSGFAATRSSAPANNKMAKKDIFMSRGAATNLHCADENESKNSFSWDGGTKRKWLEMLKSLTFVGVRLDEN